MLTKRLYGWTGSKTMFTAYRILGRVVGGLQSNAVCGLQGEEHCL